MPIEDHPDHFGSQAQVIMMMIMMTVVGLENQNTLGCVCVCVCNFFLSYNDLDTIPLLRIPNHTKSVFHGYMDQWF